MQFHPSSHLYWNINLQICKRFPNERNNLLSLNFHLETMRDCTPIFYGNVNNTQLIKWNVNKIMCFLKNQIKCRNLKSCFYRMIKVLYIFISFGWKCTDPYLEKYSTQKFDEINKICPKQKQFLTGLQQRRWISRNLESVWLPFRVFVQDCKIYLKFQWSHSLMLVNIKVSFELIW